MEAGFAKDEQTHLSGGMGSFYEQQILSVSRGSRIVYEMCF